MDEEEPTEAVALTLDESGMLCNLLMREIISLEKFKPRRSEIITPCVAAWLLRRQKHLHAKLAAANDKLMGKAQLSNELPQH